MQGYFCVKLRVQPWVVVGAWGECATVGCGACGVGFGALGKCGVGRVCQGACSGVYAVLGEGCAGVVDGVALGYVGVNAR